MNCAKARSSDGLTVIDLQVAAAVFAKLLEDAAVAGDVEMTAALHAQMREEHGGDFV